MKAPNHRHHPRTVIIASMVALGALAAPAGAQVLAGTVRDSLSHLPVAGVVVALLDSSGTTVTRQLTNEQGEYRVMLPGAVRSVRAIRIGYGARQLPTPRPATGNVQLDFSLVALPSMIQTVRILGNSRCPDRNDRAAAFGLWDQARAGLLATVVARESNPGSMFLLRFVRTFESAGEKIASMTVRADSSFATASFVAAPSVRDFVHTGFANDSGRVRTYFGPDADLLLSDEFVGAYCFQLASADLARKNQAGVRFVPADHRTGTTDIDGTLWIDTVSREIREVDFAYLDTPVAASALHPGGYVSFRSVRNGVALIDRWSLRMAFRGASFGEGAYRLTERGGELARVTWPTGREWSATLGTLRVRAVSGSGSPVRGVGVSLFPSFYFGVTDSTGTAEIADLVPGPYDVTLTDPRLVELGIGVPAHFSFDAQRDSTVVATIRVPAADLSAADRCTDSRGAALHDSVFVFGRVVTDGGGPVSGAKVTFADRKDDAWVWRKDYVITGNDGVFRSCRGWNVGDDVLINAHHDRLKDVVVKRTFESRVMAVKIILEGAP